MSQLQGGVLGCSGEKTEAGEAGGAEGEEELASYPTDPLIQRNSVFRGLFGDLRAVQGRIATRRFGHDRVLGARPRHGEEESGACSFR